MPASLISLRFESSCPTVGNNAATTIALEHPNELPKLTRFSARLVPLLSLDMLCSFLRPNIGNLRSLDLDGCQTIISSEYKVFIESGFLNSVTELRLGSPHVNDEVAELLAAKCFDLKSLYLRFATLTGVGVKALALKGGVRLEFLFMVLCAGVHRDAIDYAIAKGIHVKYGNSLVGSNGSKKLRTGEY